MEQRGNHAEMGLVVLKTSGSSHVDQPQADLEGELLPPCLSLLFFLHG